MKHKEGRKDGRKEGRSCPQKERKRRKWQEEREGWTREGNNETICFKPPLLPFSLNGRNGRTNKDKKKKHRVEKEKR
jgi:hypothetical protein